MDHHHHHHTRYPKFVLKVNINCCKQCPKKLKQWMEKTDGVYSVTVDPEKKLVFVTGKVEPDKLIKKIRSKFNKKASLYQESNHDQNHVNKDKKKPDGSHNSDNDSDDVSSDSCSGKPRRSRGGHKAEPYVESVREMVDEDICRDKFCLIHRRNSIIRNGTPFLQPPFSQRGPMPSCPPFPPPYAMRMPPPPPHPAFVYNYPRRPLSGYDRVSDYYFSDENQRGCSIM